MAQLEEGKTILESVSQELGERNALLRQELQQSKEGCVTVVTVMDSKSHHLKSLRRGHTLFLPSTDLVSCAVLEGELRMTQATVTRNVNALAWSLEERSTLTDELNQLCYVAQVVVTEVLGSGSSISRPAVQLAEVPNTVRTLISNSVFHGRWGC